MPFDPMQCLIILPLVFIAGFIDAIAGGGGLISLPAYMIAGLPAHTAIATNKLSACMGTGLTTFRFAKNGYIPWKIALPCIPAAFIGSAAGAQLTLLISDFYLKVAMLVILPLIAAYVMRDKAFKAEGEEPPLKKMILIGMGVSLVVGVYDGFYGPGTGTFLLLIYCNLAKMDVRTAGGNVKLVNLSSNIGAFVTSLRSGQVFLVLGLIGAVTSIAGHYVGSGLAIKNGSKIVRPTVVIVLILLAVKVVYELITK